MRLLVLACPPASRPRSRTITRSPSDAAFTAAASPAGPAPITSTSHSWSGQDAHSCMLSSLAGMSGRVAEVTAYDGVVDLRPHSLDARDLLVREVRIEQARGILRACVASNPLYHRAHGRECDGVVRIRR